MTNQKTIQLLADRYWLMYCESFPSLVKFDTPRIVLNGRYTKCAGCNNSDENVVQLATKFIAKFETNMLDVILPHELAHQIDYNLNGWYTRKPHHGKSWIEIMVKIDQKPEPYHTMVL
jgi:predicted SprT family Zn-dependent metalloprotease